MDIGVILAAGLATMSLIGSGVTFIVARRERAARIASELAQAELARKQAKQAEASAAQYISEAAASAVTTMQRVKEEVEGELSETRDALKSMEVRMLTLQEHLGSLMAESQECIEENVQLMKRNATLVAENKELLLRVEELILENRHLQKQVDELERKLAGVMKHVGLTGDGKPIE